MEIKNISTYSKNKITSVAIGRFDGLHLGHQQLINSLDSNCAIITIDTGLSNLTPSKYMNLFTAIPIYFYNLNEIRELSGEAFIAMLISDFPMLNKIIVGEDFRFGYKRSSGIKELKQLFPNTIVVNEFLIDGIGVHSRYIRSLILNGQVELASKFLGRHYSIVGSRIAGQGIGSKQLYPTINIQCNEFILPSEGVYITKTIINNTSYRSVSFLGHRVSTDGNYSIETYILDSFSEVGDKIILEFCKKIRENMYYENLNELKMQIQIDINKAFSYFDNF